MANKYTTALATGLLAVVYTQAAHAETDSGLSPQCEDHITQEVENKLNDPMFQKYPFGWFSLMVPYEHDANPNRHKNYKERKQAGDTTREKITDPDHACVGEERSYVDNYLYDGVMRGGLGFAFKKKLEELDTPEVEKVLKDPKGLKTPEI